MWMVCLPLKGILVFGDGFVIMLTGNSKYSQFHPTYISVFGHFMIIVSAIETAKRSS